MATYTVTVDGRVIESGIELDDPEGYRKELLAYDPSRNVVVEQYEYVLRDTITGKQFVTYAAAETWRVLRRRGKRAYDIVYPSGKTWASNVSGYDASQPNAR